MIKYTEEALRDAVSNSSSFAGVLRHLGVRQAGGTQAHITRRVRELGISTEHFLGKAHSRGSKNPRRTPESILIHRSEGKRQSAAYLRRAMESMGVPLVCSICGMLPLWNGIPLTLEVDHINGDWLNDSLDNLRFLCPNCHSQQPTNLPHKHRVGVV